MKRKCHDIVFWGFFCNVKFLQSKNLNLFYKRYVLSFTYYKTHLILSFKYTSVCFRQSTPNTNSRQKRSGNRNYERKFDPKEIEKVSLYLLLII